MTKDFLTRIGTAVGTSGYEESVAQLIKEEFQKYTDDVTVDAYYIVVARIKGDKYSEKMPKILICAHMDEIGFIVKSVDDNGFVKWTAQEVSE